MLNRRELVKRAGLVSCAAMTGVSPRWAAADSGGKPRAMVGAYYFDGWAGRNAKADDPNEPWAKDMPTHMKRRMLEEFAGREPLWGWRDDSAEIMTRQIDLAADHGLGFWAFCWYFNSDPAKVAADPKHTGMNLFMKASNNTRMKFCMLVANHGGYQLKNTEGWKQATAMWMPILTHPQHLRVGGKPLIIMFDPRDSDAAGIAHLQKAAQDAGLPGVALAACHPKPPAVGFTHTTRYNVGIGWGAGETEHRYEDLIQSIPSSWQGSPEMPHIPCMVCGWDKRPWESHDPKAHHSWYFTGRTPALFQRHVNDAIAWMDQHPEQATAERLAIIYAWNELGEGGYLVPTKDDPDGAYLKAMKAAVMTKD